MDCGIPQNEFTDPTFLTQILIQDTGLWLQTLAPKSNPLLQLIIQILK